LGVSTTTPEGGTSMARNDVPQSGKGSDSARLSQSPLSLRRGGADPTDVDDSPLNLDFSERHDYDAQAVEIRHLLMRTSNVASENGPLPILALRRSSCVGCSVPVR
jgi:hypothetical protein